MREMPSGMSEKSHPAGTTPPRHFPQPYTPQRPRQPLSPARLTYPAVDRRLLRQPAVNLMRKDNVRVVRVARAACSMLGRSECNETARGCAVCRLPPIHGICPRSRFLLFDVILVLACRKPPAESETCSE